MTVAATSVKLSKGLKARIHRLARQAGTSPHALMVQMIEERVDAAERAARFIDDARRADESMQATGTGYRAQDVHAHLEAQLAGRRTQRPKPVQWRK